MRTFLAVSAALLLLPHASGASPPPAIGSETNPEIVDGENDVEYDPLYLGPKHHGYLDTSAAWFSYEPSADTINLHVRTVDTTKIMTDGASFQVFCELVADLTDGVSNVGSVSFSWNKFENNDSITSHITIRTTRGQNGLGTSLLSVKHTFEFVLGAPGYYAWHGDRSEMQFAGVALQQPVLECAERHALLTIAGSGTNVDRAASDATFEMAEFNPPPGPGEPDPFATTTQSPTGRPDPGTSAASFALVAVALTLAVAWRRGRSP